MFDDYKKEVLGAYQKKKTDGPISSNLIGLSPGQLRDECIIVYKERYTDHDDETLRSFFGPKNNATSYIQIIESIDIDKFRPIKSFVVGKTINPELRVIELLAWLIDFKHRPSTLYYKIYKEPKLVQDRSSFPEVKKGEDELPKIPLIIPIETAKNDNNPANRLESGKEQRPDTEIGYKLVKMVDANAVGKKEEDQDVSTSIPQTHGRKIDTVEKIWLKSKITKTIAAIIIVAATGSSVYLFWKDKMDRATITNNEKCMYWVGDHYEAIACDLQTGTPKIPLNINTLNRLKKITLYDTLTKKDLGKTWYAKINDRPEFYTDSGMHPIDTVKRLKPLTSYMLSNYVSYYRYLLTRLIWSVGLLIFIVLLITMLYKYLPKRNTAK